MKGLLLEEMNILFKMVNKLICQLDIEEYLGTTTETANSVPAVETTPTW